MEPRCIKKYGRVCKTHIERKYINWPCNFEKSSYSPQERHERFVNKKTKCNDCGLPSTTHWCIKCFYKHNTHYLLGKKLPKKWKENIKRNNPFVQKGDKHPYWLGNKVDYSALHHWVRKLLGNPSKCENCGKKGERPNGKWVIHWANKSGNYKRDISDWVGLCNGCHKKHDKNTPKRALWNGVDMHFI